MAKSLHLSCKCIKTVEGAGAPCPLKKWYREMIDALNDAIGDAGKHDRGNNAAGTRVRKAMQAAKNTAQDVRKQVQADKNSR